MSVDISQANITKADLPLTFWCEDFPGLCCTGWCHESDDFLVMRRRLITVYPESIFSQPHMAKMPDFSLGLSAEKLLREIRGREITAAHLVGSEVWRETWI